jgi:hypothetical protein
MYFPYSGRYLMLIDLPDDSKSYGLKTYQNLISQRGTMQGFI